MFLANYLRNTLEPVLLDEIAQTPLAGGVEEFEEETGLNPFELTPDEVDLYRPACYRCISKNGSGQVVYKKAHDAYTLNREGEPVFPDDVSLSAVYFVRNPLDVCVSFANHNASQISKMVTLLLNDHAKMAGEKSGQLLQKLLSWKNHYRSWNGQNLIPVHVVRYEDMQKMPMETFGSIIRFLNLEYDEERLSRSIINSDFKLLQQMEQESGFKEKMQKCEHFFWKGTIGHYRDSLSEDQIKSIVDYNYEVMQQLGYIDRNGNLTV
jgi:hypothetical protein